jgi:hypothetical protein
MRAKDQQRSGVIRGCRYTLHRIVQLNRAEQM